MRPGALPFICLSVRAPHQADELPAYRVYYNGIVLRSLQGSQSMHALKKLIVSTAGVFWGSGRALRAGGYVLLGAIEKLPTAAGPNRPMLFGMGGAWRRERREGAVLVP